MKPDARAARAETRQTGQLRRAGLLAQKLGMTRVFNDAGEHVPVTVLKVDQCQVVAHCTVEKNGYVALQVGVGKAKVKNVSAAERGHFAAAKVEPKTKLVEFRVTEDALIPVGAEITVDHFLPGQFVDVTGTTTGKGFAGGIKRWKFSGLRATHGVSISHRSIGSTGGRQDPGKTFKNKKMAGHLGVEQVTTQNLRVVRTDPTQGLILVAGAVPGVAGGWIQIRDAVKRSLPAEAPMPGRYRNPLVVTDAVPSHPSSEPDAARRVNDASVWPAEDRHDSSTDERYASLDEDRQDVETVEDLVPSSDVRPDGATLLDPGSFVMTGLTSLCSNRETERIAGVEVLLVEGLKHLERGVMTRRTAKRVRSIMPALFTALFDPSQTVQRKAAIAICALRNPDRYAPGGSVVGDPDAALLLADLESYLEARKARLFSFVNVVGKRRVGDDVQVDMSVRVTDHIPLEIDGRWPRTQRPKWLSREPSIDAHVATSDGEVVIERPSRSSDGESLAVMCFSIRAGSKAQREVYVDIVVDNHSLERHLISLDVA